MGNSVIYRPAYDAEVEYLESTGTQYIDTGVTDNNVTALQINCDFSQLLSYDVTPEISLAFISRGVGNNGHVGCEILVARQEAFSYLFTFNREQLDRINVNQNNIHHYSLKLEDGVSYATLDETSVNYINNGTNTMSSSIKLFQDDNGSASKYGVFRLYNWSVSINGILVRDFIPVRIGQIGYLYDKVSKQLFANKGTGQFILGNDVSNAVIPQQRCVLYFGSQRSVIYERIYEEYEWIIGDNVAYIDGLDYNLWTNTLEIKIGKIEGDCQYFGLKLVYDAQADTRPLFWMMSSNNIYKTYFRDLKNGQGWCGYFNISDMPSEVVFSYYNENGKAVGIINGVKTYDTVSTNTLTESVWNKYIPLNTKDGNNIYTKLAKVSYIRELLPNNTYRSNLIPCKLLQPIPAILDGNGIARQAGECGMWDKVSNKFYGNVSESGTFTVKGPKCYEEYDWLRVQLYARGMAMFIPIHSRYVSFNRVWNIPNNSSYFYSLDGSDVYNYYADGTFSCVWYDNGNTRVFKGKNYSSGDVIDILTNQDSVIINGEEITWYGTDVYAINFNLSPGGGVECDFLTSPITVDGSVRYVPCKLTHGIPASMDANGIARPAGTCGMWDKVNDKFYGNVASSGSFTVSND